jgi:hypothetical protein
LAEGLDPHGYRPFDDLLSWRSPGPLREALDVQAIERRRRDRDLDGFQGRSLISTICLKVGMDFLNRRTGKAPAAAIARGPSGQALRGEGNTYAMLTDGQASGVPCHLAQKSPQGATYTTLQALPGRGGLWGQERGPLPLG